MVKAYIKKKDKIHKSLNNNANEKVYGGRYDACGSQHVS